MTEPEQPEQPEQPERHVTAHPAEPTPNDQTLPIAELVATRLAQARLTSPVKALLQEALGEVDDPASATIGRVYLDSVAVTGYRGVGARTRLGLAPGPGVNLVVGRNGSGKSSIAEGAETAFTGTNARWERQDQARRGTWRNLHDGARPRIEVRLAIEGDEARSTLTRTWDGDDFDDSEGELKRPGHGTVPADQAGWARALTDYRPFLSYIDLDHMISGKPARLYDAVNVILGLGYLGAADSRLQEEESRLRSAANSVAAEVTGLKEALYELPDEDRALRAVEAFEAVRGPDLAALEQVLSNLPAADDELLAELRLVTNLRGPHPEQVAAAVGRLREAVETVEAVRATDADDALQRADLLARALEHRNRHAGEASCPVCGTDEVLNDDWAVRAAEQVAALALFGDVTRTGDVYPELARLCGGRHAVDIVKQCQDGAHPTGVQIIDPHRFVDRIEEIATKVRKPQVTAR